MKIEIGGGPAPRYPAYKQVDIVKQGPTEIVAPAWDLPFADGSVDKIFSRHLIEHFNRTDADRAMKEWNRVLSVGGEIEAILPDIMYHVRQMLNPKAMSERCPEHTNFDHAMAGFYGWRDGPMQHLWGYTEDSIIELFEKHGFIAVWLQKPEFEGDLHVKARKGPA